MSYLDRCNIAILKEKTITEITGDAGSAELHFHCSDGTHYKMYHQQGCCESVYIEDIVGDLDDLLGSPIVGAYESSNSDNPKEGDDNNYDGSHTWTFYTIQSGKGAVTIRWYGSSNGYYSESADFGEVKA